MEKTSNGTKGDIFTIHRSGVKAMRERKAAGQ